METESYYDAMHKDDYRTQNKTINKIAYLSKLYLKNI